MAIWRRGILLAWCVAVVWLWFGLSAFSVTSDQPSASKTVAEIPVQDGIASFDLPCQTDRDQVLIIVSSLSKDAGPYAVKIETTPSFALRPLPSVREKLDPQWLARVRGRQRQLLASRESIRSVEAKIALDPPAERSFWIMVRGDDYSKASNYQRVSARLSLTGQHCAAYVDVQCPQSQQLRDLVRDSVTTFDREVFPTATRMLGSHRDVDGDGRFAILFTPWLARLAEGTVSLGGFVRGSDFFEDVEPPLGNHCDMMYLNSELEPSPHLRTIIAHEYTHAVTLSEHVFTRHLPDRQGLEEESWLDESLAHLAENLHAYSWSNLDYRISAFLNDPESYRLVVEDYYAAGLWRGHGNRGSAYLFLRWCVDQFGPELLRDLVQTNLCGIDNLEAATGKPFSELFRAWSASLFLGHSGLEDERRDDLKFLSTRGELGGWLLGGPRYDFLRLDGDSRRFTLVGTSTKYLVAHSPSQSGARVHVVAPPASELQISVRRLPVNLARVEVQATLLDDSASTRGEARYRIQVRELNGTPVRLESMTWERSCRGTNRDGESGFRSPLLGGPAIEEIFGTTLLPASGTLLADSLRVQSGPAGGTLLLKLTGQDAAGHALTAWSPLPGRAPSLEQTASTEGQIKQ